MKPFIPGLFSKVARQSFASFFVFVVLPFLWCIDARADSISGSNAPKALLSGGGNESTGQGVQADMFSGAATYNIDIPVPPGPAGIKPKIVLTYNSQRKNANSWVGYGWDLDFGAIERAPEVNGRINYDTGTSFVARIADKSLTITRTMEAANASDYGLSGYSASVVDVYQATVESDYTIYLHLYTYDTNGNVDDQGWFVKDKAGTTYQFGTDTDKYSLTRTEVTTDEGETVQWISRWNLTAVQNANANAILIEYNSSFQPDAIAYGDISIDFAYTSRTYFPLFKQYGLSQAQANNILSGISVRNASGQLMGYSLEYTESVQANHSLLTSITQTGADGVSLPPTTFQYYDLDADSFAWAETPVVFSGTRDDCSYPTTAGYAGEHSVITDMNGDALPDLVLSCQSNDHIKVLYNTGNGFEDRGAASDWTDPLYDEGCSITAQGTWYTLCGKLNGGYANSNGPNQIMYLIDMNGDALPDRVLAVDSSSGNNSQKDFLISFNTGSGFDPNLLRWRDPYIGNGSGASDSQSSLIDMNGDGLVDRVHGANSLQGFNVYFNYGAGFSTTPEHWIDTISLYGDTWGHADIYSPYTGDTKAFYLKDFNGDGYTDRFRKVDNCYQDDVNQGPCLSVEVNREGHEWALPDYNPSAHGTIVDGIDNLGILDPVINPGNIAEMGPAADWVDFNGDGIVDRIEGDTNNDSFNVFLYDGMTSSEDYMTFDSLHVLADPIADATRRGIITSAEGSDTDGALIYGFIMDMNGDGFPDRVYADGNAFYVHFLQVNPLTFSDAAAGTAAHNQPLLALKSVDDGRGGSMVIEYLPSTQNPRSPQPYHRFLPFTVYTTHKIYLKDPSLVGTDGSVEGLRNPGYRYSTYDFIGGHFYVKNAVKASTDPDTETLATNRYVTFNGFQTVNVTSNPGPGETWQASTETSVFHQALGDIDHVEASDESLFDASAYGDLALSGRLYNKTKTVGSTTLTSYQNNWTLTPLDSDLGINLVTLGEKTETVTEPGETLGRTHRVVYDYDSYANVTSEVEYDGNGIELQTKQIGYHDTTAFEASLGIKNRVSSQTVSQGGIQYQKTEFAYDTQGNQTTENVYFNASQYHTITHTYTSLGNVETVTDIDGVQQVFAYDADGVFATSDTVTLPGGATLTTTYDHDRASGLVTEMRDENGVGRQTTYDSFGRKTNDYAVDAGGNATLDTSTSYLYGTYTLDSWSNVTLLKVSVWQPRDNYTDTSTAANPAEISYLDAYGHVLQSCEYTERGNYRLVQSRITNGGKTITKTEPVFSSDCAFVSSLSASTAKITVQNDDFGRPISVDFPTGDSASPVSDASIDYTTASEGTLTKTVSYTGGKTIVDRHDALGRLSSKTDEANNTLSYTYNPVGDLLTVSQGGANLVSLAYDWLGRKTQSYDANLGTWSYAYNTNGQLSRQTDNKGQFVELIYDTAGRVTRKNVYGPGTVLTRYISYTYDTGDASHSVSPGDLYKVEEYDGSGTLIRTSKQGYDSDFHYANKITRSLSAGDFLQTLTRDFRGETQSVSYPGDNSLYYHYNRTGVLKALCSVEGCDSSAGEVYYSIADDDGYNEFGSLLRETYGNGVTTDYEYFPASHRLKGVTTAKGTNQYSSRSVSYDDHANITSITDALGQTNAAALSATTYDSLSRLTSYTPTTSGTSVAFTYDEKGNVLTNGATHGSDVYQYTSSKPHAVTQIGSQSITYDDNGNMTNDGLRAMTYNAENQLTQVTLSNGTVATYDYDFTGNRVVKSVTRVSPDLTTTTNTIQYLGNSIEIRDDLVLLHISANGKRIVTRTLGNLADLVTGGLMGLPAVDLSGWSQPLPGLVLLLLWLLGAALQNLGAFRCRPLSGYRATALAMIFLIVVNPIFVGFEGQAWASTSEPDNSYFYYHHGDHLGSSHIITEGNSSDIHSGITYNRGDLVQRYEYDPFGQDSYALQPQSEMPLSFTGQVYDDETRLYYYKARYYDPTLARFIQPDTMVPNTGNLQSYNRYSYAENNPLKYTDPTGHFSVGFGGGAMGPDTDNLPSIASPDLLNGFNLMSVGGIFAIGQAMFFGSMSLPQVADAGKTSVDIRICIGHHCFLEDENGVVSVYIDESRRGIPDANPVIEDSVLDGIQIGLDVLGMIPAFGEIADGANALIYLARGDYINMGLSAGAMIPFAGWAATAGKWGKRVEREFKVIGRLGDTAVAKGWKGHSVLNLRKWSLEANMAWIDDGIEHMDSFYLASPKSGNMIQTSGRFAKQPTVFAKEIQRIEDVGYKQIGDYYVHPNNLGQSRP